MANSSLVVLFVQIIMSFIIFAIATRWYLLPYLDQFSQSKKMEILLWFHVFRYLPLVLLARQQIDPGIPRDVAQIIAFGDFSSSLIALVTIILLRQENRLAMVFAWSFQLISTVDIISALFTAMTEQLYQYMLGFNWFILTVYVPIVIITQLILLTVMLTSDSSEIE